MTLLRKRRLIGASRGPPARKEARRTPQLALRHLVHHKHREQENPVPPLARLEDTHLKFLPRRTHRKARAEQRKVLPPKDHSRARS